MELLVLLLLLHQTLALALPLAIPAAFPDGEFINISLYFSQPFSCLFALSSLSAHALDTLVYSTTGHHPSCIFVGRLQFQVLVSSFPNAANCLSLRLIPA